MKRLTINNFDKLEGENTYQCYRTHPEYTIDSSYGVFTILVTTEGPDVYSIRLRRTRELMRMWFWVTRIIRDGNTVFVTKEYDCGDATDVVTAVIPVEAFGTPESMLRTFYNANWVE